MGSVEYRVLNNAEEEVLKIFLEKYDENEERYVRVNILNDFPKYIQYNLGVVEELYYKGYLLSKPTISVSGPCSVFLSEEAFTYFQIKEGLVNNMNSKLGKKGIEILDFLTEHIVSTESNDGNLEITPEVYENKGFQFEVFNNILKDLEKKGFIKIYSVDLDGNFYILFYEYKYEEYKESIEREHKDENKTENKIEEEKQEIKENKLLWQIIIPIIKIYRDICI